MNHERDVVTVVQSMSHGLHRTIHILEQRLKQQKECHEIVRMHTGRPIHELEDFVVLRQISGSQEIFKGQRAQVQDKLSCTDLANESVTTSALSLAVQLPGIPIARKMPW
jgi:hypothetical protein